MNTLPHAENIALGSHAEITHVHHDEEVNETKNYMIDTLLIDEAITLSDHDEWTLEELLYERLEFKQDEIDFYINQQLQNQY